MQLYDLRGNYSNEFKCLMSLSLLLNFDSPDAKCVTMLFDVKYWWAISRSLSLWVLSWNRTEGSAERGEYPNSFLSMSMLNLLLPQVVISSLTSFASSSPSANYTAVSISLSLLFLLLPLCPLVTKHILSVMFEQTVARWSPPLLIVLFASSLAFSISDVT